MPLHESALFDPPVAVDPSEIQYGNLDVLIGEGPSISIANAQVTEGNSGTTPMVFEVTLSSAHLLPVTVSYATSNGTAVAPGDYQAATGQVTFAPGETTQTITVNVVGDTVLESAETFNVTLSNPINAEIDVPQAIGTILDDEVRSLTISDRVIIEGGAGTFTVTLSSPAANPITVNFATVDGTATAGLDYVPTGGVLTFNSGEQSKTITVQTIPDDVPDDGETFTVTLSSPSAQPSRMAQAWARSPKWRWRGCRASSSSTSMATVKKPRARRASPARRSSCLASRLYRAAALSKSRTFTQTDATGRYIFENLPTGSYSIHEIQPAFFNDGVDTAGQGGVVTANDWMFINFTEGGTAAGFNFGEAGLRPQFMGKRMFLASNLTNGDSTLNLSGGDALVAFDSGFSSINVQAFRIRYKPRRSRSSTTI